jgi:hypothetical protein
LKNEHECERGRSVLSGWWLEGIEREVGRRKAIEVSSNGIIKRVLIEIEIISEY